MTAIVKFCPVCGQGMFIKQNAEGDIFICVDDNCGAKLKIIIDKNEIILIEYKEKGDIG